MLRRKKSGLRAMPSQIRDKDPNCRIPKSKKPALGLVFLNSGAGLGIDYCFYDFDIYGLFLM